MDLLTLCESLKKNAESVAELVVRRWEEIAGAEPWLSLPSDLDFDHLPQLICALAEGALCTDYDRHQCRRVATLASAHGDHRASQGFGDTLIYREYHLLRRALAERLKRQHGESAGIYYASMRVDALISLASAAALYGVNRTALVDQDRWPGVLDELLADWPLPDA